MPSVRASEGGFCYTELMAKREIDLTKLVINNYTTEEILSFCVRGLASKMTEEALGSDFVYWDVLKELEEKVCGKKSTKIL